MHIKTSDKFKDELKYYLSQSRIKEGAIHYLRLGTTKSEILCIEIEVVIEIAYARH